MRLFSTSAAALLAGALSTGCSVFGGTAAPEPEYRVEVSEPPFEIRRYPTLTVARTRVSGTRDEAVDVGFGRLFDYIRGGNRPAAEIPMTAPVLTGRAEDHDVWQVLFVLPPELNTENAPRPKDSDVEIATLAPRRVAVARFSGSLDTANIAEARDDLAQWLAARAEQPVGEWQAAGYNPPWTLPWLRRNEVMVPLADPE